MDTTSASARCPKCGRPVPNAAAEGLCPSCLLEAAITPTEAGTAESFAAAPPSVERVAAAFPQLEIIQLIGAGGMGAVFKARQPKLDRFVALKILPEALGRDPAFAERFHREARVLAKLNHPNIVTVHDFGQSEGFLYLLMEYVDGVNLRQAMRGGRFTPTQALALVPRICEALQFAHEERVLHRDIKPENILLDTRGRLKIADFGLAKLLTDASPEVGLTRSGRAVGTPQYMAPEQIEHPAEVDHRADIYSLGVVFYELLTGELPLGRFAPPSAKAELDARVDEIVLRALTKERELRQQSAREMQTDVEGLAASPLSKVAHRPAAIAEVPSQGALWRQPELQRQAVAALLLMLLGCVGYALARDWMMWGRRIIAAFTYVNWLQMAAAGAGLIVLGWFVLHSWVKQHTWLSGLELEGAPATKGSQRTLGSIFIGLVVCLGLTFMTGLILQGTLLAELLAQGRLDGPTGYLIAYLFVMMVPVWAGVRRELRRKSQAVAAPLPQWAGRVAAGCLVAACVSAVATVIGSLTGWSGVGWYSEYLVVTSVALWTGSRFWRAVALWLNVSWLTVNVPQAVGFLFFAATGKLTPAEGYVEGASADVMKHFPTQAALCGLLALLALVAATATLLHPSVRAYFRLPARHGQAAAGNVEPTAP